MLLVSSVGAEFRRKFLGKPPIEGRNGHTGKKIREFGGNSTVKLGRVWALVADERQELVSAVTGRDAIRTPNAEHR